MKKSKLTIISLLLVAMLLLSQVYVLPGLVAKEDHVYAEEETASSIIDAAKQELQNRKAKNKFVLEDGYQGFFEQYLYGWNDAWEILNNVNTELTSVEDAKVKVEEAYAREQLAFTETFKDATDTSIASLQTLTNSMSEHATNEEVKARVKAFEDEAKQKITSAHTLGEQISVIEPLRSTAFQKLGEFEREVLLDELKAEYEKLKASTNNLDELTRVYEAKKSDIQSIKIDRSGVINQEVGNKENPTMGNYVTANKQALLQELKTAAETPTSPVEEDDAEEADVTKLQNFVRDTTYTAERNPDGPYDPPYFLQQYKDEYKALVEEGKQILAKDKKTATEVKDLNEKFQALVDKLEQSANERMGLAVTLIGAPLTDEEGLRDYTPSSWQAYKPILEKAVALIDKSDASAEELDAMADELAQAISDLKPIAKFHELESTLKLWENVPSYTDTYTTDTHPAFVEAYKEAQEVANNKDNDQQTIDAAHKKLKDAFASLKVRVTKHHNENAIKQVHHDMGVNGEERDKLDKLSRQQYTPESFDNFFALYDENLALIADTTTSNEKENEERFAAKAKELLEAMANLQRRANTKALKDKITEAEKKLADGNYEEEGVKKLQALINEGKKLIEDANVSQNDVDAKRSAIEEAMTELVEKIDYTNLDAAITKANDVDKETLTKKSKGDLEAAITKAQGVREKDPVTQEEVEAAAKELNDVVENLQEKADKDALKQKIDELKDKDLNDYTDETKTAFEDALKKAEDVLKKEDATQKDVDDALKALTEAEKGLKEKGKNTKPSTTAQTPSSSKVTQDPKQQADKKGLPRSGEALPLASAGALMGLAAAALFVRKKQTDN